MAKATGGSKVDIKKLSEELETSEIDGKSLDVIFKMYDGKRGSKKQEEAQIYFMGIVLVCKVDELKKLGKAKRMELANRFLDGFFLNYKEALENAKGQEDFLTFGLVHDLGNCVSHLPWSLEEFTKELGQERISQIYFKYGELLNKYSWHIKWMGERYIKEIDVRLIRKPIPKQAEWENAIRAFHKRHNIPMPEIADNE